MIWVIPVFEKMFKEMSGGKMALPGPTQLVIDMSNFAQGNWYIILGVIVAAVVAVKKYYATPQGKLAIDKLLLKLPVFGDLIRKASVAKFTRTLGTLLASGVPLLEALTICAKTSGNKVVEGALLDAKVSISGGKTIAEPLAKSGTFPKMVTHMISVGESTGALDSMLGKIADFYEDEVDQAVTNLTALLEPMMMVFLGVTSGLSWSRCICRSSRWRPRSGRQIDGFGPCKRLRFLKRRIRGRSTHRRVLFVVYDSERRISQDIVRDRSTVSTESRLDVMAMSGHLLGGGSVSWEISKPEFTG